MSLIDTEPSPFIRAQIFNAAHRSEREIRRLRVVRSLMDPRPSFVTFFGNDPIVASRYYVNLREDMITEDDRRLKQALKAGTYITCFPNPNEEPYDWMKHDPDLHPIFDTSVDDNVFTTAARRIIPKDQIAS